MSMLEGWHIRFPLHEETVDFTRNEHGDDGCATEDDAEGFEQDHVPPALKVV